LPDIVERTEAVLRVAERHGELAEEVVQTARQHGRSRRTSSADLSRFDILSKGLREMAGQLWRQR